jgi:hypothetical protein
MLLMLQTIPAAAPSGSWGFLAAVLVGLAILYVVMRVLASRYSERILKLDRRIIYVIVALCVLIPMLKPLALPILPSAETRGVFEALDKLPPGSHVMVGADFDPASQAELLPMLNAVLQHCFARKLKPVIMTLWPAAPRLMQTSIERQAKRYGAVSGTDYAWLGYKPGNAAVIIGLLSGIPGTYNTDNYGKPTASMPIIEQAGKLSDYDYIVDIAAGESVLIWLIYGAERAKVPMGISVTAVSATQYYPYLQAGQISGLAGGMKGSAEYERLLRDAYPQENLPPGDAMKGMDSQSMVHLFIVLAIVMANIAYFASRRSATPRRAAA